MSWSNHDRILASCRCSHAPCLFVLRIFERSTWEHARVQKYYHTRSLVHRALSMCLVLCCCIQSSARAVHFTDLSLSLLQQIPKALSRKSSESSSRGVLTLSNELADIQVRLELTSTQTVVATTKTNVNGRFALSNITPGRYAVLIKNIQPRSSYSSEMEISVSCSECTPSETLNEILSRGSSSKTLTFVVTKAGASFSGIIKSTSSTNKRSNWCEALWLVKI